MRSAEETIRSLGQTYGLPEASLRAAWLRAVEAYEDPVPRVEALCRASRVTDPFELALCRDVDLLPARIALSRPVRDALRSRS